MRGVTKAETAVPTMPAPNTPVAKPLRWASYQAEQNGMPIAKTVPAMPDDKATAVRTEINAEFGRQRDVMVEGLSKEYADKFSLDELKHLNGIYDDKVYQKFQAINADPNSTVTGISQNAVAKLINMLSVAAAGDKGPSPAPMPRMAPSASMRSTRPITSAGSRPVAAATAW